MCKTKIVVISSGIPKGTPKDAYQRIIKERVQKEKGSKTKITFFYCKMLDLANIDFQNKIREATLIICTFPATKEPKIEGIPIELRPSLAA